VDLHQIIKFVCCRLSVGLGHGNLFYQCSGTVNNRGQSEFGGGCTGYEIHSTFAELKYAKE
jgi:hypothetical protein